MKVASLPKEIVIVENKSIKLDIINLDGRNSPMHAINEVKKFDSTFAKRNKQDTFRDGLAASKIISRPNVLIKFNRYAKRAKAKGYKYTSKKFTNMFNSVARMSDKYVHLGENNQIKPVTHNDVHKLVENTRKQFGLPRSKKLSWDTTNPKHSSKYFHITEFRPINHRRTRPVKFTKISIPTNIKKAKILRSRRGQQR